MQTGSFFSTNLKFLREKLSLSKDAFGKTLKLNRGVIASYEAQPNPSEPKFALLREIAFHLSKGSQEVNLETLIVKDLRKENFVFDVDAVIESLGQKKEDVSKVPEDLKKAIRLLIPLRVNSDENEISVPYEPFRVVLDYLIDFSLRG